MWSVVVVVVVFVVVVVVVVLSVVETFVPLRSVQFSPWSIVPSPLKSAASWIIRDLST
jgi:hypothetical protein